MDFKDISVFFNQNFNLIFCLVLTVVTQTAFAVNPGEKAPNFSVKNQDGKIVSLEDFHGKSILLYFYPKDDTPGCTLEAQNFRDDMPNYDKLNTVVLGVSRQGAESHQKFRDKYNINFDLLVDDEGSLAQLYGIEKVPVIGFLKRQSVLIDPDGKVVKFYSDVNPKIHSKEVLEDLERLGSVRH